MKKYFEILCRSLLFAEIGEEEMPGMIQCLGAKEISFAKGQIIFSEGSPAKNIGIMLSGQAQIERTDYFGNRSILGLAGPGDLFGEAFACAGVAALPVQVTAAEECQVLLLDCQKILATCSKACHFHSRLIYNLLKIMADKNLMLQRRAEILSCRTTRDKLMSYLTWQAKQKGRSSFFIPFDRQELADYLEVDRSGLSSEIGKLRKEGILECEKSTFRLLQGA